MTWFDHFLMLSQAIALLFSRQLFFEKSILSMVEGKMIFIVVFGLGSTISLYGGSLVALEGCGGA
jgi:hypothetical protein